MTSAEVDDISESVQKHKDSAQTESIEAPHPTGKSKRPISDKQRDALAVGRTKRRAHFAAAPADPKPAKLDTRANDDSVEQSTETLTADSVDDTAKILKRVQKRVAELERKREKDKQRKLVKQEVKKRLFQTGGGPLNDTKTLRDPDEERRYKKDNNVPAPAREQSEQSDYVMNRRLWNHQGLMSGCFRV